MSGCSCEGGDACLGARQCDVLSEIVNADAGDGLAGFDGIADLDEDVDDASG